MRYTPHSEAEIQEMLSALGLNSLDELFNDIPQEILDRCNLPDKKGLDEIQLRRLLTRLSQRNVSADKATCFVGAGCYDSYIPAAVSELLSREEFYTAYTPYQPELSQGILQSIFEYQTYICRLTGLDVANASLYDGGSALASACAVATEATRKKRILIPDTVHPEYQKIVQTYASGGMMTVEIISQEDGVTSLQELAEKLDDTVAAVVIPQTNYYGVIEPVDEIISLVRSQSKALAIMLVDPVALAILKTPGEYGADIAVGEGQPLGNPMSDGGPSLGFMAAAQKWMRKIPGRLVGETKDSQGNRAFVLTLQAREQHIRREKANSNICSNQALNALAASIYFALVGPKGFRQAAERSHRLALYARDQFLANGFSLLYNRPFFREFVIQTDDPEEILARATNQWEDLASDEEDYYDDGLEVVDEETPLPEETSDEEKPTLPSSRRFRDYAPMLIGGLPVEEGILFAFTEKRTVEEIDRLVEVMIHARNSFVQEARQ